MVENIVEDNGTSLNDFGGDVTVFSLGSALDEGAIVIIQKSAYELFTFLGILGRIYSLSPTCSVCRFSAFVIGIDEFSPHAQKINSFLY
jgi:hypothetical protein